MKIPKPRRLPSGSWTVRVKLDGRQYSITRPTEKACLSEAMALKTGAKRQAAQRTTLTAAIDSYIEDRRNVLSPSTIRGYRAIQAERFKAYMRKDISTMTSEQWQRAVNQEAKLCNAKTLRNAWGFIASVIADSTGNRPTVRLPQVIRNDRAFLDSSQIPVFVSALRASEQGFPGIEIPALLMLNSLRQSEMLAVTWDDIDIDNGTLTVRASVVLGEDGKPVRKAETKTSRSRRTIPILPPLADALHRADPALPLIRYSANTIRRHINQICRDAGLQEPSNHGLRHSFASLCYGRVSEQVAQEIGGWSDPGTMRRIYTHISERELAEKAQALSDFFTESATRSATEFE